MDWYLLAIGYITGVIVTIGVILYAELSED